MENSNQIYNAYLNSSGVSIDSRSIKKGSLFFALKGPNFDGNQFANDALKKGASYVVVDDPNSVEINDNIFLVEDSLNALQKLALHHRKQLKIPIIAITGSNGKTTTKELIREVLSQKFLVHSTKGNMNNHIGVPITILQISKNHEVAIIEMGANHLKEIKKLCSIALPNWGYITNFGKAHLEGFGSEQGVINGKSELYEYLGKNNGKILVNKDDLIQVEKTRKYTRYLFGSKRDCDIIVDYFESKNGLSIGFKKYEFESPIHGNYNFENIAAALSFGILFEIDIDKIQKAIASYDSKNNRSEKIIINKTPFILDAYNANPTSMGVALDSFCDNYSRNNLVILGDMFELGKQTFTEHENILKKCLELDITNIYTIGSNFMSTKINNKRIKKFDNIEQFKVSFEKFKIHFESALIKGSRSMKLEKLIPFFKSL
ncbi:UDP-N-acetylmuramoyl-tripeptide--D-alanyl-D-alanine ligase [Bacteroidetes bacterium SCGC AAA795-G10]|nr:UDP-N-acetylmuramoyl-tripeptide--D-alanyl-D-alanine ligase [Bacteroidetes bacterium SCGC AAA795-G10]